MKRYELVIEENAASLGATLKSKGDGFNKNEIIGFLFCHAISLNTLKTVAPSDTGGHVMIPGICNILLAVGLTWTWYGDQPAVILINALVGLALIVRGYGR